MEAVATSGLQGSAAKPPARPSKEARELEGVFLGLVVNEMLESSAPKTMNGGHGEELFRSFLGNEIGAVIAETGGVGLAADIDRSMKAYQK